MERLADDRNLALAAGGGIRQADLPQIGNIDVFQSRGVHAAAVQIDRPGNGSE